MLNIFVMINKSDYYITLGECRILLKEYKTQERKKWRRRRRENEDDTR